MDLALVRRWERPAWQQWPSMAGAAAMSGMTSMAGSASAVKAAYEKAQANMGGDGGGAMPSFGSSGSTMTGGNDSGGVSAFASAMGGDGGGAMPSFGGSDTKGNAQDGATAAKAGKGSTSTIANLAQGAM